MRVDIVTIFPDYLAPLDLSLIGRARAGGLLDLAVHDLRRWTHDVHRTVDDTPYGGGPGMVMRPEPWGEALDYLCPPPAAGTAPEPRVAGVPGAAGDPTGVAAAPDIGVGVDTGGQVRTAGGAAAPEPVVSGPPRLLVPSPAGSRFTQALAAELIEEPHLIFACGRYEGIDQRVLDHASTRMEVTEVSLGDYVLFGGEVAVLVILEAVVRLLPGVLGNAESLTEESHANGLLEAPVFTKPPVWRGLAVPDVLRSGDHGRIARWRRDRALARTARQRPDLLTVLAPQSLDKRDVAVLAETGFLVPGSDMAK